MSFRAALDIGGSFAAMVFMEMDAETGAARVVNAHKAPVSEDAPLQLFLDGLAENDIAPREIELFVYGAGHVCDTLVNRSGARTGLITTKGFRDVLEIARGNRPDFFNLTYQKPAPYVPRYRCREVSERLNHHGGVITPLDFTAVDGIMQDFLAEGVDAVAICLMHAYVNPAHEKALADYIRERWPALAVTASHEISREWREYERANTAVMTAYAARDAARDFREVENTLTNKGFTGVVYAAQSNGGINLAAGAARSPLTMLRSGVANGVFAAGVVADAVGLKDIVAFDMGANTAHASFIVDGQMAPTDCYMFEQSAQRAGFPVAMPFVDVLKLGDGGNASVSVDAFGRLELDGAAGDAVAATLTGANILLGRLDPAMFPAGISAPSVEDAEAAFARLGATLGLDGAVVARGILRLAHDRLENALRLAANQNGHDLRDFAMIAYGGAGAMHGTAIAADVGLHKVIVPAFSSVFPAWGMLMSDMRRDFVRTRPGVIDAASYIDIDTTFAEMEADAVASYGADGVGPKRVSVERAIYMRYLGQEHVERIAVRPGELSAGDIDELIDDFRAAYERDRGYRLDNAIEVVSYSISAFGDVRRPALIATGCGGAVALAYKGRRRVDWGEDGVEMTAIYDRAALGGGATLRGPAIIEEIGATIVLYANQVAHVDDFGNIHIEI